MENFNYTYKVSSIWKVGIKRKDLCEGAGGYILVVKNQKSGGMKAICHDSKRMRTRYAGKRMQSKSLYIGTRVPTNLDQRILACRDQHHCCEEAQFFFR